MASPRPRPAPAASADPEPDTVVLPPVSADPLSYLGPRQTAIEFLGREWLVPALSAADWLEIIWTEPFSPEEIFPGMVNDPELDDAISEALFVDDFDPDSVGEVAMEMIEAASGYRWWFTLKLCTTMRVSWSRIGGMLVLAGVDPNRVTLGSWCSAALALLAEHVRPKEYAKLLFDLNMAPPGYEASEEEEMVMDEAEFMAAMSSPY